MKCPKCRREIEDRDVCPNCNYRLETETQTSSNFKNFVKENSLAIEVILSIFVVIMLITSITISNQKNTIQKQYNELQTKLDTTSKNLQKQIDEKNTKLLDNEKKISELQQEEKQNEINNSIKSLETEKQKLEGEKNALEEEKQKLNTQIEELKKTSSTISQNKSTAAKTSTSSTAKTSAQNTNSTIVYVTNTGKKYHKSNCSYLKKSKIEMSLSNAQSSGYTPCSKCY